MDRGPLSVNAHAMLEPLIAILIAASPWLFGYSENDTATTIAVIIGAVVLLTGMMTKWRVSLAKVIPLRQHMMADLGVALFLIVAPFIFGFSDDGGATRFFVIAGVAELIATLGTRWNTSEQVEGTGARTARA